MKLIRTIILCTTCLIGLGGCNSWLDIDPSGQVSADKLLEDEIGYKELLTGVYNTLSDRKAYGCDLTCGVTDALAQYWILNTVHELYDFGQYNTRAEKVEARLQGIWNQMYKAIGDLNLLLDNIVKADPAGFADYDLIKGEALGLRAYLHLDLLRLFGPVLADGANRTSPAIPYRDEYSKNRIPVMTACAVLEKIRTDLEEAYALLQNDPVKTLGRRTKKFDSGVLGSGSDIESRGIAYNFRGIRMNYYAVAASLARYHMLVGEKQQAARYAQEVIDDGIFTLMKRDERFADNDKLFITELVFGLYKRNMYPQLNYVFLDNLSSDSGDYRLETSKPHKDAIFLAGYGFSDDVRLNTLLWSSEQIYAKYKWSDGGVTTNTYAQPLLPMIRISEMYYIVAESLIGSDNSTAMDRIDDVREARNLPTLLPSQRDNMSDEALLDLIVEESRKDFFAEGKMFYMYKRLNRPILAINSSIAPSNRVFVMPLPSDEVELGQ